MMMLMNMTMMIMVCRYEFASPEVLAGTTETLRKETLCMFTPDEVSNEHISPQQRKEGIKPMLTIDNKAGGGTHQCQGHPPNIFDKRCGTRWREFSSSSHRQFR